MSFVVYRGERRIGDLVRRTFGPLEARDQKRAREALLRANPHLEDIGEVADGSLIVVPRVPGLRLIDDSESDAPAAEAVEALSESLAGYLEDLREAADADRERTDELAGLLSDRRLTSLLSKHEEGDALRERLNAAIKQKSERAEERDAILDAAKQGVEALDELRDRLGG